MSYIRHGVLSVCACNDELISRLRRDAIDFFRMREDDLYFSSVVSEVSAGLKGYTGFAVVFPGRVPELVYLFSVELDACRMKECTLEYVVCEFGGDTDGVSVISPVEGDW